MKFNIEGKAEIIAPTPRQITHALKSLRSYGKSSYASLTDASGSYVQVAGGGVSCMIERFQFGAQRWRAFHDKPSPVRPDGTILAFRAGNIPMRSDEWFIADQVVEVFLAFLNGAPYPPFVHWRPAVSAGVNATLNDGARLSETVNNKGAARAPLLCARSIRTAGHVR